MITISVENKQIVNWTFAEEPINDQGTGNNFSIDSSLKKVYKDYSSLCKLDNIMLFIGSADNGQLMSYMSNGKIKIKSIDKNLCCKIVNADEYLQAEKCAYSLLSKVKKNSNSYIYCLPLIKKENYIMLTFIANDTNIISEQGRFIIKLLAEHVALILEFESYKKMFSKTNSDLALLLRINKLINSGEKYESILSEIIDKLSEILEAETGGILLFDFDNQQLVLQKPAFGVTDDELINAYRVSLGTGGNAETVFLSGEPYISNNAPSDPRFLQEYIKLFNVRNTISVPLQIEKRTIGVIHLINKKRGAFNEQDVEILSVLASQIAGLIEKTRIFEEMKRQEQETNTLYEIGLDIFPIIDLNTILNTVVNKVEKLFLSDMMAVAVIEDKVNCTLKSINKVCDIEKNILLNSKIPLNQGILSSVVNFRKPMSKLFNHSLNEENSFEKALQLQGYRSILVVPIEDIKEIIGTFICCRKSCVGFTEREKNLLSRLASQVFITIEKARLYEQKEKSLKELREFNAIIENQRFMLKKSLEIHDELTKIVLHNNGFQAVVNTLSKLIDLPVIVIDKFFRKIAYCSGNKEESNKLKNVNCIDIMSNLKIQNILREMNYTKKLYILPSLSEYGLCKPVLLAPIVINVNIEGYTIVFADQDTVPNELDLVAIEHATSIFALELVKKRITFEVENKLKGDYLDELLTGNYNSEEEILEKASFLGYDLSKPHHQVIVIEVIFDKNIKDLNRIAIKNNIMEILSDYVKQKSPDNIIVTRGDSIVILTKIIKNFKPVDLAKDILLELQNVCPSLKTTYPSFKINIGIGCEVKALKDFCISFEEAKQANQVIGKYNKGNQVASFDDLGLFTLLGKIEKKEELQIFINKYLGPILEYDSKKGTQLYSTLDSFLSNGCNIRQTARASFLHVNTLNYRLSRIKEILNVDFKDNDNKLKLQVAIKAYEMLSSS